MEHPLIGNLDDLTVEELQRVIGDLTKKLAWASRMGNASMTGQIRMALESYQVKLADKQQAIWEEAHRKSSDYASKIDIS